MNWNNKLNEGQIIRNKMYIQSAVEPLRFIQNYGIKSDLLIKIIDYCTIASVDGLYTVEMQCIHVHCSGNWLWS